MKCYLLKWLIEGNWDGLVTWIGWITTESIATKGREVMRGCGKEEGWGWKGNRICDMFVGKKEKTCNSILSWVSTGKRSRYVWCNQMSERATRIRTGRINLRGEMGPCTVKRVETIYCLRYKICGWLREGGWKQGVGEVESLLCLVRIHFGRWSVASIWVIFLERRSIIPLYMQIAVMYLAHCMLSVPARGLECVQNIMCIVYIWLILSVRKRELAALRKSGCPHCACGTKEAVV
jgi:hypothetical protein